LLPLFIFVLLDVERVSDLLFSNRESCSLFCQVVTVAMDAFLKAFAGKDFLDIVAGNSSLPEPPSNPAEAEVQARGSSVADLGKQRPQTPSPPPWRHLRPKRPAPKAMPASPVTPPESEDEEFQQQQQPASSSRPAPETAQEAQMSALELYQISEKAIRDAAWNYGKDPNDDPAYKRTEHLVATQYQIKRRDRGPKDDPNIYKWRNQIWRPGSQRFSTRGGRSREYFKQKYGGKSKPAEQE
jgi:hypothetical protein